MEYYSNHDYLYHYGVKGMKWGVRHDKQRNQLSDKQKRVIKRIAITTAVTVGAAAAGYSLYKYGQKNFDSVIKSGVKIQHMSRTTDEVLNHPFYASYLPKDNKIYTKNNLFGAHFETKMMAKSSKNIRIAGKRNAERIYREWLNTDPVAKQRFGSQSYFSFNRNLNTPDYRDKKIISNFYKELQKHGYSAIRDVNDQFQTGVTSPVIIFGSLKDIKVIDISKAAPRII